MYICGGDDSSYTKCFSSLEDVDEVLELISEDLDGVDTFAFMKDLQFTFTN
jgi:hypothetical protein